MLEIRDLRLIADLAAHGSIVRVARLQGVTQPTLSRSLAAIEARLGSLLFDRTRRGLWPTDMCRAILTSGADILAQMEGLNSTIAELRGGPQAALRIAAAPYPLDTIMVSAAAQFAAQNPEVQLRIEACTPIEAQRLLHDRRVDLAVADISELDTPEAFVVTPLLRHPILFHVRPGHPLLRRGGSLELGDVLAHPLIAPSYLTTRISLQLTRAREQARRQGGHDVFPAIVIEPVATAIAIAMEGDFLAAATLPAAAKAVAAGHLRTLPWHEPWLTVNFGILALRGRKQSGMAQRMIDQIVAVDDHMFGASRALLPGALKPVPRMPAILGRRLSPLISA